MNAKDKEAVNRFKEGHLYGITKLLKATGGLQPAIHLFGRKGIGYEMGIFPVMMEGELPIPIIRMFSDKMFDELLCVSYSCEATMWKCDYKSSGIDEKEMENLQKNDPRLLAMKKNAKPLDILWITFETGDGQDVKVYEVIRAGGSMVNTFGQLADDVQLKEMIDSPPQEGTNMAGRFANIFKRIKNTL